MELILDEMHIEFHFQGKSSLCDRSQAMHALLTECLHGVSCQNCDRWGSMDLTAVGQSEMLVAGIATNLSMASFNKYGPLESE